MGKTPRNIVIITGIYPPEIGGPAEYVKNLAEVWRDQGYLVDIEIFSKFNFLPTGIRHIVYFFSIIPSILIADYIFIIDTFSAAFPAVLVSWILRKKTVLRTGGDFLWEAYVERTGDKVLLIDFYKKSLKLLAFKEKIVFRMIKWLLHHTDTIIWSTEWQKDIFMEPYKLSKNKHVIVENYYGPRHESQEPQEKIFIGSGREIKWKNLDVLQKIFDREDVKKSGVVLDAEKVPHGFFLEKIKRAYAVIVVSLGDISPNVILDAIMCKKPFIITKETGLYNRIKSIAVFVDPQNENDIADKICWLSRSENYEIQKKKLEEFDFVHTWEDIAYEYMSAYDNLK
jgi:glycosyltransferase involved in cell wall biosynthesis